MIPSCPTCSKVFATDRIPHVIPCGHSICSECLAEVELSGICCEKEFLPANCPINHTLREQINNEEKSDDGLVWNCSVCTFQIHPKQARICVKCLDNEAAENTTVGLNIHDMEKAEKLLICAHCAIESQHNFHITVLYLPAKMKKIVELRGKELSTLITKGAISPYEASNLQNVVEHLKESTVKADSWLEFDQTWNDVDAAVKKLVTSNRNINNYLGKIDKLTQRIEEKKDEKQQIFAQLTCIIGGIEMDPPFVIIRQRSNLSSRSNSDTDSSVSLRHFGVVEDLSSPTEE